MCDFRLHLSFGQRVHARQCPLSSVLYHTYTNYMRSCVASKHTTNSEEDKTVLLRTNRGAMKKNSEKTAYISVVNMHTVMYTTIYMWFFLLNSNIRCFNDFFVCECNVLAFGNIFKSFITTI